MINKTTYLRSTKSYTAISTTATAGNLSVGAVGLLTLILSNRDTYVIYKSVIQKRSGVGKKLFARFWKELVDNQFIYEIMSNNGRIKYEYILVNDPSNKTNIHAVDMTLDNREPFITDGEQETDNDLLDIADEMEGTNITLSNSATSNIDLKNEDLTNASLAISNLLNSDKNVDELKEYWYENIHDKKLSKLEEEEILTQELFVSTLNHTVSSFIHNKTLCEKIKWKYSLKSFYYVFNMTVRDLKFNNKPLTVIDISEEVISFIQK